MLMLRRIASSLATFGPVGRLPFANLLAVLLSLPVVVAVDALVWPLPFLYPGIYVALFVFCMGVILFALANDEDNRPPRSAFMINHMLGLLIVFSGIALNLKLLLTGLVLFLLIRHFLPRALLKFAGLDCFAWVPLLGILFVDLAAGFAVNFIFRFIFWLVAMPR
jgi:hypothetical protein